MTKPTPRVTTGSARPRVLLVDNSTDEREMYAEYLRLRGYCTLQAATAHDGFRMAADLAPDVIVTGLRLGGEENGLGLTARLKQDTSTRAAIVIMLSGCVYPADRAAALRAGCDQFLEKPCVPEALEAAVTAFMDQRSA